MPNSEEIQLSILIVNFKSENYLDNCIASIYDKLASVKIEIIIVNNDASEDLKKIKKCYPEIRIIHNLKNIGFGRAHNIGASEASGKYLLIINPDTQIISADLENVFGKMEQDKEIGILGLKIIDKKGNRQKWTVGFREMNFYDLIRNNTPFVRKGVNNQKVFWVSGAAFIIEKELFISINGFDENFFMYFEDIDLCIRVRKGGRKILTSDAFVVKHIEGGSQQDKVKQKKDFYISQDYYYKKHFGRLTGMTVKILRKIFA